MISIAIPKTSKNAASWCNLVYHGEEAGRLKINLARLLSLFIEKEVGGLWDLTVQVTIMS